MKKLYPLIILFTVVTGFALSARAQESRTVDEKDAAALTKIYREFEETEKKKILVLIEKYLGDDYSVETDGEKLDKKQVVERLNTFFNAVKEITEAKSSIEKIEFSGGQYVVEVDSLTRGKFALAEGKTSDFLFTSKTTDFWRKDKDGRWRETKQIDRGTKILIDGKEPAVD